MHYTAFLNIVSKNSSVISSTLRICLAVSGVSYK